MSERNSIDLVSDPRSIIGSRIFDAPRDLVFEAWTDPKHLSQWWGPLGFSTTTKTFDMRAGGVWRFVMHGPDGRDYQNRITYEEIVRPERIVYSHGGGGDVEPVTFRVVVTFEDIGGKTRLTMRGTFPTPEARARVIAEYGADKGMQQTLTRLNHYVGTLGYGFDFTMTRIFDAPRGLVWEACTEARHLAQWWGPRKYVNTVLEMDVRPGGHWRIEQRGPDGAVHPFRGVFLQVEQPKRLVHTFIYRDYPAALVTITFESVDGKTKLTSTTQFKSKQAHDGMVVTGGAEKGASESYDRLAELLTRM